MIIKVSPTGLNFKVVFTTAHDDFAIKAFQYNASDYLLKPISPRDLQRIMQKISLQAANDSPLLSDQTRNLQRISIPSMEGVLFLDLDEIIRLESEVKYTTFYYGQNQKAVVSKNLGHYANLLPLDQFHRVDQSHIVNLHFVRQYLHQDGGYVVLKNGDKITIDAEKNIIKAHLTKAEIATRKAKWKTPKIKAKNGILRKYANNVSSASEGCVTDEF